MDDLKKLRDHGEAIQILLWVIIDGFVKIS